MTWSFHVVCASILCDDNSVVSWFSSKRTYNSGGVAGQAGSAVAIPVFSVAKPQLPITNNYEGVASHQRARASAICSCVDYDAKIICQRRPTPAATLFSFPKRPFEKNAATYGPFQASWFRSSALTE